MPIFFFVFCFSFFFLGGELCFFLKGKNSKANNNKIFYLCSLFFLFLMPEKGILFFISVPVVKKREREEQYFVFQNSHVLMFISFVCVFLKRFFLLIIIISKVTKIRSEIRSDNSFSRIASGCDFPAWARLALTLCKCQKKNKIFVFEKKKRKSFLLLKTKNAEKKRRTK